MRPSGRVRPEDYSPASAITRRSSLATASRSARTSTAKAELMRAARVREAGAHRKELSSPKIEFHLFGRQVISTLDASGQASGAGATAPRSRPRSGISHSCDGSRRGMGLPGGRA